MDVQEKLMYHTTTSRLKSQKLLLLLQIDMPTNVICTGLASDLEVNLTLSGLKYRLRTSPTRAHQLPNNIVHLSWTGRLTRYPRAASHGVRNLELETTLSTCLVHN